jgi:hypothetical protein
VRLELLSPLGALFGLAAVVPLAALFWVERTSQRVRALLGLGSDPVRPSIAVAGSLVAVPILLAVALAQPVVRYTGAHLVRTDAEAFYVFDVSRSMLAAASPESPRRFGQAVETAKRLHQRLADIPSGVATMTDRVVPSLFPTGNDEVFNATVEDALAAGQPPPRGYDDVGTLFAAVDTFASGTFFSRTTKHRVAIVLTDGESRPFDVPLLEQTLALGPPVTFVVLRFGSTRDRVWQEGKPIAGFRPTTTGEQRTAELVRATGGTEVRPRDTDRVVRVVRDAVGSGPRVEQGELLRVIGLGPWFALASLAPLGFLVWRRNIV